MKAAETTETAGNPGEKAYRCGMVALVGRPNSGKSTLVNTVLEEHLCVVTPLPQTTRRVLRGIFTSKTMQIVFVDTPGMHLGDHTFNKNIVSQSSGVMRDQGVDVIAYIVDLFREPGKEEDIVAAKVAAANRPVVVIFNKTDICPDCDGRIKAFFTRYPKLRGNPYIAITATEKKARGKFITAVLPFIPEGNPMYGEDDLTDADMRFFAAEYLHKAIILSTREELPHASCIEILDYQESPERHLVDAVIHVETTGQRGILVGKNGAMIGRIRTIAEKELSQLAGVKVIFRCHVKITPKWRDNPRFLNSMGYRAR